MKTKIPILALVLALILTEAGVALANGGIELPRWVLGGGATDSAAGSVSLRATLGQPVVGVVSSEDFSVRQGFCPSPTPTHNTYLPLVMRDYRPPLTFPLHIGDAIAVRAAAYQGEVFYTATVPMPEPLPASGHFYFSSQGDAVTEVLVDDELAVLLEGTPVFTHRFSSEGREPEAAVVEVPRAVMEQLAGQVVTLENRDVCGVLVQASALWLLWVP